MPKLIDLTGKVFDKLTVLEKAPSRARHVYWKCQCKCGNIVEVSAESLKRNIPHDCGCVKLQLQREKEQAKENKLNYLVGKRFGRLVVESRTEERQNGSVVWKCKCDCGNYKNVPTHSLQNNHTQSCGCLIREVQGIDITNQKFGKLTALYPIESNSSSLMWHCKCECGNEIDVIAGSLTSGNTKSCGCLKKENAHFTQLKSNLVGQRFGKLLVVEETKERQYEKVVWKCQCDCGNIVYLNTTRLRQGNDISCGCQKTSYGASQIEKLLKNNNLNYKKEYSNKELNGKRFDFALLNKNNEVIRLIEFDGEQHYRYSGGWNTKKNMILTQQRDQVKNEYALSHNIPLVRIPYWERDKITLDMILGSTYEVRETNQPTN